VVALRLILAVCAVLGVLAAPAGYMPARAADGDIILMICPRVKAPDPSAGHAMHAEMDTMAHGKDAAGSDNDEHGMAKDSPCDYVVGAVADVPTLAFAILQPDLPRLDEVPVARPLTGIFPRGLPPSTGPPHA
jgi:hypothetical protein|tara:strand:+ start:3139 stop:3537 length:399 start_codon:yes stop_codon:yes gene_type:complete